MNSPLDRRLFLGTALAAGTFPLAGVAPAAAGPQGRPGSTRFVNLNQVLKGWDDAKRRHTELESELKSRAEALMARANDLDKKAKEAKQFPVPTEASRKLEREVQLGVQELELDRNDLKRDQRERQLRLLLSEYQQIQDAAAKWAKQNQIEVVFAIVDEDPSEGDLAARYQRAVERPVLWHAPELDATAEILKLLQAGTGAPATRPK